MQKITDRQRDRLAELAEQPSERRGNRRGAATDDSLIRRGLVVTEVRPLEDWSNLTERVLVITTAGREALAGVPAGTTQALRDAERDALAPYKVGE